LALVIFVFSPFARLTPFKVIAFGQTIVTGLGQQSNYFRNTVKNVWISNKHKKNIKKNKALVGYF